MESVEGVRRFLSRKDKEGSSHRRQKSRDKSADKKTRPKSVDNLFNLFKADPQKKEDKEQKDKEKEKVDQIKKHLKRRGYSDIGDSQISYAIDSRYAAGDVEKAVDLLFLFQESVEGVIKPYDPAVVMQGAVNRDAVTCYLDSVLFAMFAKLESFEPILYKNFEDDARKNLSMLIRLWVNMMRSGKLIDIEITGHLQDALAVCGWEPDGRNEQQDASDFFMFLTDKLQLPLLELKVDLYYDATKNTKDRDDHRVVQERLLDVAVPDEEISGRTIRLEDCLETYFNNTVEVKRALNRSASVRTNGSASSDKAEAVHVEARELTGSNPGTPISIHPPSSPLRRVNGRTRTDSLITTRVELLKETSLGGQEGGPSTAPDTPTRHRMQRKESKEVGIPAWQFFNLMRPYPLYHISPDFSSITSPVPGLIDNLAWYTQTTSVGTDGEIAEYFKRAVPTLCIRLKRYGVNERGEPFRKNTLIDIPVDIRLPHFVDEENVVQGGPLMGNFQLSLQSVICHRGISTFDGHYVSFIRGVTETADGDSTSLKQLSNSSLPPNYPVDKWIKHDDLSNVRVQNVDIEQALKDEMPFLLFYQVQPLHLPLTHIYDMEPPAYALDPGINVQISEASPLVANDGGSFFDRSRRNSRSVLSSEPELRRSLNLPESRRGSIPPEKSPERAIHITLPETTQKTTIHHPEDGSISTASSILGLELSSVPTTPTEESTSQRLSRAAWAFRSGSRSRPTSSSGENRMSSTFTRLVRNGDKPASKDATYSAVSLHPLNTTTDAVGDVFSQIAKPGSESPTRTEAKLKQSHSKTRLKSKESKGKLPASGEAQKKKLHKELPDRQCIVM